MSYTVSAATVACCPKKNYKLLIREENKNIQWSIGLAVLIAWHVMFRRQILQMLFCSRPNRFHCIFYLPRSQGAMDSFVEETGICSFVKSLQEGTLPQVCCFGWNPFHRRLWLIVSMVLGLLFFSKYNGWLEACLCAVTLEDIRLNKILMEDISVLPSNSCGENLSKRTFLKLSPTVFHLGQHNVVVGNWRSWSHKKKKKANGQKSRAQTEREMMGRLHLLKQ